MPNKAGDLTRIEALACERQPELFYTFVEAPMKCRHGTAGQLGDLDHREVLVESECNQNAILGSDLIERRLQCGLESLDAPPQIGILNGDF